MLARRRSSRMQKPRQQCSCRGLLVLALLEGDRSGSPARPVGRLRSYHTAWVHAALILVMYKAHRLSAHTVHYLHG